MDALNNLIADVVLATHQAEYEVKLRETAYCNKFVVAIQFLQSNKIPVTGQTVITDVLLANKNFAMAGDLKLSEISFAQAKRIHALTLNNMTLLEAGRVMEIKRPQLMRVHDFKCLNEQQMLIQMEQLMTKLSVLIKK